MPAKYGSVPVSERDAEEGRAASGAASAPLVNPGRFEAVRQLQSGRRAGWRRTADVLTGGVIVVGCLVLVASLGSSSGGPRTATTHAPASGGQAPELQALSGLATLGRMGSQLGDEVKAGTEKLISILDWGYVNPDTGMIRAQCDDSVAEGSFGSHDEAMIGRFHGNVGDRFSVECPAHCSMATVAVYGCHYGPFMDETSICKAAVGAKLIGDDTGGMVTIELVEPVDHYEACTMRGLNDLDDKSKGRVQIETFKWIWYKWRYPDRATSINRFCDAEWKSANPGVPCEKAIKHYRMQCKKTSGHDHCFGANAFKFVPPNPRPQIEPEEGVFEDSVDLKVTPTDDDPSTFIVCTTDGSAPDASAPGKMPPVPPDGIVTLGPGNYTVQCQSASSLLGPSRYARAHVDVLPRLPMPDIDPDSESTFVEEVMVSIDPVEDGATVFYTLDGSDPTEDSEEYNEPFMIDSIGQNTVKAMSIKVEWASSHVATSEILLLERVATPSFEPYMGAFTDTVTVNLKSETAGASFYYTVDGSVPNDASTEYSSDKGIVLGLDPEGKEASYVIRALASLPPGMGDSVVATSGKIIVQPQVEPPVIVPESAGPYTDSVEVTVTCATPGASIYYSTDGSAPSLTSMAYFAPFALTQTDGVVKAKAFAPHMSASDETESVAYELKVSDPVFAPDGGVFVDSVTLAISSATPGAAIHYTLDGSDPVGTSPMYTAPFAVGVTDLAVKAVALHKGLAPSNVVESAVYTVKASAPVLDPMEGDFTAEALIKVTSATTGAELRCTLDGSDPTADTDVVTSPVSVTETGSLVSCVATREGLTVSDVTSMPSAIVIKAIPPVITPDSGEFTNQATIVMSCESAGCTIYYTTDGSVPTPSATLYTEPVVVTTTGTVVKCVSVADGKSTSDVSATSAFAISASAPTFYSNGTAWQGHEAADAEFYVEDAVISMESSTPGAVIVYTIDGQAPGTESGIKYVDPYEDTSYGQTTIKAITYADGKLPSPMSMSLVYDVVRKTQMPVIAPNTGGPFTAEVTVTINIPFGSKCYMTLDGSAPTYHSPEYVEPFVINAIGTTVVKAKLTQTGQDDSDVAEQSFFVLERCKTPAFEPSSGVFADTVKVHLSSETEGSSIRYTTDGSEPNAASPQYTDDGIDLDLGADGAQTIYQIKAMAMLPPDMGNSLVATSGSFVVQPVVALPVFTPDTEGPYKDTLQVSIACATPGAVIHYTTSGVDPTISSPVFTGAPITLTSTGIAVKAMAIAEKMTGSAVAVSPAFVLEASDPTFGPDGGIFVNSVLVTLTTATPDASIHYTLDGSDPGGTSPMYTGPFAVGETDLAIKAIAMHINLAPSNVVESAVYTVKASAPVLDPMEGDFTAEALIKVTSATQGAKVRCTLDGSDPNDETWAVLAPVSVEETNTIVKCIATKNGLTSSDITSTLSAIVIKAIPPVITPDSGEFTNQATIVMSCESAGCTIYYTTDGSVPTPSATLYTEPVVVTTTGTVVKCVSVADGKSTSDVSATSALKIFARAPTFSANGTAWQGHEAADAEFYVENALVSMESDTPGAVIVFTTDGKNPSADAGTEYTEPYEDTMYGQQDLKAIVFAPGKLESPIATSLIYDIVHRSPVPKITPNTGGPFTANVMVTISASQQGGTIHFTTDGTDPSTQSEKYLEPFLITQIGTSEIKAMLSVPDQADSFTVEQSFLVLEQVKTPTFTPNMGVFTDTVLVHAACETAGASIRYTTDGSEPNAGSREYDPEIGIALELGDDGTQTIYQIKAMAMLPPDMGSSLVATSGSFVVQPQVAEPVFTPDTEGPYKDTLQVSIACATPGAVIHYTTSGVDPTISSPVFTGAPITLTSTGIAVKAMAIAEKMTGSAVAVSPAFVLEASDPTFGPDGGVFVNSVLVTLTTATPDASIHYTLDGTDPDFMSNLYAGPFTVGETDLAIKAIAMHINLAPSNVVESAVYTVKASAPVLDPMEGDFTAEALIKVTSATAGAELRCTLDGSDPSDKLLFDNNVVTSPVSVTETGSLVSCVAIREGLTVSDVTSMASAIVIKAIPPVITPDSGEFTNQGTIVMSCESAGCTIYYTTDGSVPTPSATLYTEPVVVTTTGTVIRAVSTGDGKSTSDETVTSPFSIHASAPTFLANGTMWGIHDDVEEDYVENAVISMASDTPGAVIVYTVDGQMPTDKHGTQYTEPYEDTNYGRETVNAITFAEGMLPSPIASSLIYDIVRKSPRPSISPNSGGPFTDHVLVSIHSPLLAQGGKCFMTTDGSDPTPTSTQYTEPFVLSAVGTTIIKAIATQVNQADSEIVETSFLVLEQVQAPTFDLTSGTFTDSVTVHVACETEGATVRYTTDGSEPNAASDEYYPDQGIELSLPEDGTETTYVIKALAMNPPDMGDSPVVPTGVFTVQPQVDTPQILPAGAESPFKDSVEVRLLCDTPGAQVRFTTDGSDPTSESALVYSGPFIMSNLSPAKNVVRVVAFKAHMAQSVEVTEDYVIKPGACTPSFDVQEGVYVQGLEVHISCPVLHHGVPGKVYYEIVPADDEGKEPDETSREYTGVIYMDEVGNQTIRAVTLGHHVLASAVIQSPFYAIKPDPVCDADEYEPHTGNGTQEVEFDIFDRNCDPCPTGGTSPRHSKGRLACVAQKGYTGPAGGPFVMCPLGHYKDFTGQGACVLCPPRSSTEFPGGDDVTSCRALPGSEGPDGGPFQTCPEDTYSEVMGMVHCLQCPEGGTTRGEVGDFSSRKCVALPGWTNENDWTQGPFVKCGFGQYKSVYGPHPCKDCPFCSTTVDKASASPRQCVADIGCEGKGFGWGLGFTKCKSGTFKPSVGNGDCPPCDASTADADSCGGAFGR